MIKESFIDVKSRISRDDFRNMLETVGREETVKQLNLSLANFGYLVHYYDAESILERQKQEKRKLAYQKRAEEKQQRLLSLVSKESLVEYYITQNHSLEHTAAHFNVPTSNILQLIKFYDCKKPKTVSRVLSDKTKEDKYGSAKYNNREQATKTCLERYGVENVAQVTDFIAQSYATKCLHYGEANSNNWRQGHQTRITNSGSLEASYAAQSETYKQQCLNKYGVENPAKLASVKDKIRNSTKETFRARYGADCYWLTDNATRSTGSKDSSYNLLFASKLDGLGIKYNREVAVGRFIYDFQINNYLVEINPTPTHNVTWSPYSEIGIATDYHRRKSQNALDNGYRCIHVWDWDDSDKLIHALLCKREKIYARNCTLTDVSKAEAKDFINTHHLQGYANDAIRLGLYYNNELVSVMTFGRPRYSRKVDFELIRYCSSKTIVGGAEKLFKHFIDEYQPNSIVSYCDTSKFAGDVYSKLGFVYKSTALSSHWYNIKTGQHILDSLLRSRGFDQLFGTTYGKGTSNKDLIIQHGFVEVVDSGQATYIWNKLQQQR